MSCHCSDWQECGQCDCHRKNNPEEYGNCAGCHEEIWLDTEENYKHDDGTWYCENCAINCAECNDVMHPDDVMKCSAGEPFCESCYGELEPCECGNCEYCEDMKEEVTDGEK